MYDKVLRLLAWGVVLLGLAVFTLAAPLPPGFARWLVGGTLSGLAGAMGFAALLHLRLMNKGVLGDSGPASREPDPGKSRTDISRIP